MLGVRKGYESDLPRLRNTTIKLGVWTENQMYPDHQIDTKKPGSSNEIWIRPVQTTKRRNKIRSSNRLRFGGAQTTKSTKKP